MSARSYRLTGRTCGSLEATTNPWKHAFKTIAPAAIIVAVVLVAYAPAIKGGFIWDDNRYVTNNPTLRDTAGLKRMWFQIGATPQYYPLVFTTFWLERSMWGVGHPAGYHITNVLLHAANAVLLWLILRKLKIPGAWAASMLFAVHPVHVESVAWITERKNVLSGLFYLAAFLAYLRFCGIDEHDDKQPRRWRFYVLALILFAGALASKTVTCTLPAAIALILWWKRDDLRWRDIVPLVPTIFLAAAMGTVTAIMEQQVVGARGADWNLSIIERTLIAGRAVWFYAYSILAPVNLMFIYPRWRIDAAEWWQYLFPAAVVVGIGFLAVCRNRWGKGPLVASLFFVGTLSPALGFINVYPMLFSFVADHFQYLASIGLIALIAAMGTRACARLSGVVRTTFFSAIIMALLTITWKQAAIYKDRKTLWTETIRRNPNAWIAHNNLSEPLLAEANFTGAAEQALAALKLHPNYAPAHNNLGLAFEGMRRDDEAAKEYRRAIELDPSLVPAKLNLAGQLVAHNDFDGAEREYERAIAAAPGLGDAHYNYAVLLAMRGRVPEAVRECRAACALNPDDTQCRLLLRTLIQSKNER